MGCAHSRLMALSCVIGLAVGCAPELTFCAYSGGGLGCGGSVRGQSHGLGGHVNYILVMGNERDDLVVIGSVPIGYQVAMIGDELEESAG